MMSKLTERRGDASTNHRKSATMCQLLKGSGTRRFWCDSHHSQNIGSIENSNHEFSSKIPFDTAEASIKHQLHALILMMMKHMQNLQSYSTRGAQAADHVSVARPAATLAKLAAAATVTKASKFSRAVSIAQQCCIKLAKVLACVQTAAAAQRGGAVRVVQPAARVDVSVGANVEVATGSFGHVLASAITEASSRN
jgi:hypothetical protein